MSPYKGWDEDMVRRKRGASNTEEGTSPTRKRVQSSTPLSPPPTTSFTPINLTRSSPEAGSYPHAEANRAHTHIHPGFTKLQPASGHQTTPHTPARKNAAPASQLTTPPATDEQVHKARKRPTKKTPAFSDGLPITKPKSKPTKAESKDVSSSVSTRAVAEPLCMVKDVKPVDNFLLDQTVVNKLACFRYQAKHTTNATGKQGDFELPPSAAPAQSKSSPRPVLVASVEIGTSSVLDEKDHRGTFAGGQSTQEEAQTDAPHDFVAEPKLNKLLLGSHAGSLPLIKSSTASPEQSTGQPKPPQQDDLYISCAKPNGDFSVPPPRCVDESPRYYQEQVSSPKLLPSTHESQSPLVGQFTSQVHYTKDDSSLITPQQPTTNRASSEDSADLLDDVDDKDFLTLFPAHSVPQSSVIELASDAIIAEDNVIDEIGRLQGGDSELQDPSLVWSESQPDEDFGAYGSGKHLKSQQGVEERYSPPSDLQYPFDDNSQTLEVYDSNLSGSPISPQNSHSAHHKAEHTQHAENPSLETHFTPTVPYQEMPDEDDNGAIASNGDATDWREEDEDWAFLNEREVGELFDLAAAAPDSEEEPIAHAYGEGIQPQNALNHQPASIIAPSTSVDPCGPLEWNMAGTPKPFVRPPFPKRIRDRSPVSGLSAKTLLRTCFRVGEALNAGSAAARNGQDVLVELYARVNFSYREAEGWKQHFQFSDLFHDRPPFLNGVYEKWRGVGLWDYDSSLFLGNDAKGRMCRCVGRIKRDDKTNAWILVVLNIWAAVWDDVAFVRGIVCA